MSRLARRLNSTPVMEGEKSDDSPQRSPLTPTAFETFAKFRWQRRGAEQYEAVRESAPGGNMTWKYMSVLRSKDDCEESHRSFKKRRRTTCGVVCDCDSCRNYIPRFTNFVSGLKIILA